MLLLKYRQSRIGAQLCCIERERVGTRFSSLPQALGQLCTLSVLEGRTDSWSLK